MCGTECFIVAMFRFYWSINAGAIIAFTAVSYLQQEVTFFYGYLVPFSCMVIALGMFVAGRGRYIHEPPTG
jgi:peptide/histidine transporter 3/4